MLEISSKKYKCVTDCCSPLFLPMAPKKSFPRKGNPGLLASTIIRKSGWDTITLSDAAIPLSPGEKSSYELTFLSIEKINAIARSKHNIFMYIFYD